MREIKFRGQRLDNGEWEFGDLSQWTEEDGRHRTFISFEGLEPIEVHPESVGQYTGLKDKKEDEIYEWDIVSNNWGGIGVIVLCNGCWSIKWDEEEFDFLFAELEDHIEVIGNVIDNKELLNEK